MVVRYKAIISYDGTNFEGYQIQPTKRTIQGEIQNALSIMNNQEIKIYASGRTDAKVHALAQVIHFDSTLNITLDKYQYALNNLLPDDIYIKKLEIVDESFHARFSAIKKHYRYLVNTGEYNVFKNNYEYQYNEELDVIKMINVAKLFVGEHDYRNFTSTKEENTQSFIRKIDSFTIKKDHDLIVFDVIGDGFMRYMVRMMVGTLLKIGENKIDESEILTRLDNLNDNPCSFKAPGEGLYLVEVIY